MNLKLNKVHEKKNIFFFKFKNVCSLKRKNIITKLMYDWSNIIIWFLLDIEQIVPNPHDITQEINLAQPCQNEIWLVRDTVEKAFAPSITALSCR